MMTGPERHASHPSLDGHAIETHPLGSISLGLSLLALRTRVRTP
jgi:hypothetical protein